MEQLHISVGKSRFETDWKNKAITWDQFTERLVDPVRTHETSIEYTKMKKPAQANIKDVGGFVGGYIEGGRRTPTNIKYRTMITLDVDFALGTELLAPLSLIYGCKAALYSTHSHLPEKPKLRIIIPLDRKVTPDEYQAIARKLAGTLGINQFDDTTYQAERLMYWPSVSKNGQYVYDTVDGSYLKASSILDAYEDWTDCAQWPTSERESTVMRKTMKKLGDPLSKPGMIGAFNRTFTITEVLEGELAEVYSPTGGGRYTYTLGTSAAGLVVYDDLFAFSHHSTDPVAMQLCNAFDLVRLHKFGEQDADAAPDCASNRLPSFVAMTKFCQSLEKVKQQIVLEGMTAAQEDFKDVELPEGVESLPEKVDWSLELNTKGKPLSTIDNAILVLSFDPRLKGTIAYNELSKTITSTEKGLQDIAEIDDARIRHYLEKAYQISGIQKVSDATLIVAQKNTYHPVRDYLDALKWDGVKRLDNLLIDFLGASDGGYTRAVTRKTFLACVARVYKPGIKFDNMLTLVGKEGIGKSTLLNKMGKGWFSDSFSTVVGKESVEQILGFWIIEVAELSGLRKAEVEQIRHFLSKRKDTFRAAYARRTETHLRRCVFIATTNEEEFLNDKFNRRYWAVRVNQQEPAKDVFTELGPIVDQLWAEAKQGFEEGETLFLGKLLEEEARLRQASHRKLDVRLGVIEQYLDIPLPKDYYSRDIESRARYTLGFGGDISEESCEMIRQSVSIAEIWAECFGGAKKDLNRRQSNEITALMTEMPGWKRSDHIGRVKGYGPQRTYVRIKEDEKKKA